MDESAEKPTVEELIARYKREGFFDQQRRQLLNRFTSSESYPDFRRGIELLTDSEIQQNPDLLDRDRGKAAVLISGAIHRSNIYDEIKTSVLNSEKQTPEIGNAIRDKLSEMTRSDKSVSSSEVRR